MKNFIKYIEEPTKELKAMLTHSDDELEQMREEDLEAKADREYEPTEHYSYLDK